jgi:adenylate cyclase
MKKSIGTRIFGLAVFLLALTISLVGFLLWQVSQLEAKLQTLAHRDIPLASSLSRLDEFGLRRRLAFERMFGALNPSPPNDKILTEAQTNYELFTTKLAGEFKIAKQLLDSADAHDTRSIELGAIAELLRQIEEAYPPITERQQQALGLQRRGDHDSANLLLDGLNDLQRIVQKQRSDLQNRTALRAEEIAQDALAVQRRITWLSLPATASTVFLGLLVAAWVTRGLVRPVRLLIGAMGDVQRGRLDLELPVTGTDEIGSLTSAFNFFVRELRSKAMIKETFGKYVDPRILDRVLESSGRVEADGDREIMTVAFADLVGFTGSSERLTPASMVKMLNRHFALQANAVQEHQGVVDKFIGDAVMAFWGPPFVSPGEHAVLSCRAALAQVAALDVLRAELPELTGLRLDAPKIDLRIGLAAGEVIVGNIGADHTRNYTVIGDTVNIASRIESANRIYGTQILLNEAVAQAAAAEFELREIDAITVKGRSEHIRIFELLGVKGCLSPQARLARDSYGDGLKAYRASDWETARSAFEKVLQQKPDDRASLTMLERIAILGARLEGESWDGIWKLTDK